MVAATSIPHTADVRTANGRPLRTTIDMEKVEFLEKEIGQLRKGHVFLRDISIDALYYGSKMDEVEDKAPERYDFDKFLV